MSAEFIMFLVDSISDRLSWNRWKSLILAIKNCKAMESNFGLRQIELCPEYNTEDHNIISNLYSPCLKVSKNYDRAVGYFRANIYRELGEDLLNFVIAGGKVRIVCSPDIPELDEIAAREGYASRGKSSFEEQEITLMNALEVMAKNPKESDCLDMLRLLIEHGSLDLFIAMRTGGIYHRKNWNFF